MADYPIIFSTAMVRAILDGRKTMTRRRANGERLPTRAERMADASVGARAKRRAVPSTWLRVQPGDLLWVRERLNRVGVEGVSYPADGSAHPDARWVWERDSLASIHMPRWLSRLTLEVTATKVERLQEITDEDACAEGCGLYVVGHGFITEHELRDDPGYSVYLAPRQGFEVVWRELHGDEAWDQNPAVVCLSFNAIRRNIDAINDKAA